MNDFDKNTLIQSAIARMQEAIRGCRRRRTKGKQHEEYVRLIEKLGKIFFGVKAKCEGDIKIMDEIGINIHDWLQTYTPDKEIKSNIIKILVMVFNS